MLSLFSRPDGSNWTNAFKYLQNENSIYTGIPIGETVAASSSRFLDVRGITSGKRTLENVLAELFDGKYKNSPGHYANMMNETHNTVSTAVSIDPELDGSLGFQDIYNVQVFGRESTTNSSKN